jgi:hypothetical protein
VRMWAAAAARPARVGDGACSGRRGGMSVVAGGGACFPSVRCAEGEVGWGPAQGQRPKRRRVEDWRGIIALAWNGTECARARAADPALAYTYTHSGIGRVDPLDGSSLARAVVPQLTS